MSAMDVVRRAVRLSNEAARLLLQPKRVLEALRTFETALTLLRGIAVDGTKGLNDENVTDSTGQEQAPLKLGQRIGIQCDTWDMMDRPLLLPEDPRIKPQELDSFLHWTSTAIMFNYALACHQYGSHTGRDSCNDKAVNVYQLALRMVQTSDSDHDMYAVLECAALNNVAHLLFQQCVFDQSAYMVQELSAVLSSPVCLQSYLSSEDIEGFLMNTMFAHAPVLAQAA